MTGLNYTYLLFVKTVHWLGTGRPAKRTRNRDSARNCHKRCRGASSVYTYLLQNHHPSSRAERPSVCCARRPHWCRHYCECCLSHLTCLHLTSILVNQSASITLLMPDSVGSVFFHVWSGHSGIPHEHSDHVLQFYCCSCGLLSNTLYAQT